MDFWKKIFSFGKKNFFFRQKIFKKFFRFFEKKIFMVGAKMLKKYKKCWKFPQTSTTFFNAFEIQKWIFGKKFFPLVKKIFFFRQKILKKFFRFFEKKIFMVGAKMLKKYKKCWKFPQTSTTFFNAF